MEYNYYDVHCFYSRNDGCSYGVKIPVDLNLTKEEDIINYGIKIEIYDSEDARYIDYVAEMEKEDFIKLFES